jgi:hypothetical protein
METLNFGLTLVRTPEGLEISGKTFHSKEALKTLGGKWSGEKKVWILPLDADISSLRRPPPPPISASMRQQMADYYISDSYLRRVIGRSRHGRCCSEATTKLDDFNPQGPMWYVCTKHGNYKSDYDGT